MKRPSRNQNGAAKPYQGLEPPTFWIVAGPNGSGKSTLYSTTNFQEFGQTIWIINPDHLAARIRDRENLITGEYLNRIMAWLRSSIKAYQTIGVETVLSTSKYRRLVALAKANGFRVRLLYVVLRDVDLNIARVKARVANGGHDVPVDKIIARRARSLQQLPWFVAHSDEASIYDNSSAKPEPVFNWSRDKRAIGLIESAIRTDLFRPIVEAVHLLNRQEGGSISVSRL